MTASADIRRSYPQGATVDFWSRQTAKDRRLRTFRRAAAEPRGSILWLGGRGDVFEKYLECLDDWHRAGWNVASFDWHGQGGSGRVLPAQPLVGHVGDFSGWIDDLRDFGADWQNSAPGPHVVIGHSMGGHLVLRGLIERAIDPDAVVLSAPMLGFGGRIPTGVTRTVATLLGATAPYRSAWKTNERPAAPTASRQAFLTHDADRYADEIWWKAEKPELSLGPPSWGWMAAAARSFAILDAPGAMEAVRNPILIIGTDGDALVSAKAIRRAAMRLPNADLLMFDTAVAHEVLREIDVVRDAAMRRIAAFLDKVTK